MFKMFYNVMLISCLIAVTGCAQQNQNSYSFEPDKSVITGSLTTEQLEGEVPYIFVLDAPIDVVSKNGQHEEGDYNTTKTGITKVQLTSTHGVSFQGLIGKRLKLTGTFFGGATAHHHTEVLMDVESFDEVKK